MKVRVKTLEEVKKYCDEKNFKITEREDTTLLNVDSTEGSRVHEIYPIELGGVVVDVIKTSRYLGDSIDYYCCPKESWSFPSFFLDLEHAEESDEA